jgi:virginiamycin B lyase
MGPFIGADRIMSSNGFDRPGWEHVMAGMMNAGSPLPKDQLAMVTDYLVANFPPKALPAPAVVPGNTEISIQEWVVPTPGSRPHDPLSAADGSIWYAGQFANALGRLDPKTGQIKEYHPKTPHSGPHGLMEDKSGNIWFTANFKSYIGKLDPKTGEFTEYPMRSRP